MMRPTGMGMLAIGVSRLLCSVALLAAVATMPGGIAAKAYADSCSDVVVMFARGTFEPPGVGVTGRAFVNALQGRLPTESVEVYAVDYPASLDFTNGAGQGVVNAYDKVIEVVSRCPNTKIVDGGYSQGAAVAAYLTSDIVPANFVLPQGLNGPLPPDIARNIAAVVLFGKPSAGFVNFLVRDAPPIAIGPLYADKTIELCIPEDPVCSPTGTNQSTHGAYAVNGMADQAADFAADAITSRAQAQS